MKFDVNNGVVRVEHDNPEKTAPVEVALDSLVSVDLDRGVGGDDCALVLVREGGSRDVFLVDHEQGKKVIGDLRKVGVKSAAAEDEPKPKAKPKDAEPKPEAPKK